MAETYSFFNSAEGDIREYQASEFAKYFSKFLSDGVFSEDEIMGLNVETVSGLDIKAGTGFAYVRGYLYENDADISFTLDSADNVLDRIDRVVLKLDIVNRTMNVKLKKGGLGSTPTPPALVDDANIKELPIAQIRINKNAATGIIKDERTPVRSATKPPGVQIYSSGVEPQNMIMGDIWLKELV